MARMQQEEMNESENESKRRPDIALYVTSCLLHLTIDQLVTPYFLQTEKIILVRKNLKKGVPCMQVRRITFCKF
jgi:hypothetical protein